MAATPPRAHLDDANIIVKAEKVNKYFGDLHVLKDVSLEVRKNEVVMVLGPSGSGKSTLLNLIGLLDRPTSGKYLLEEQGSAASAEETWPN